MKKLIALASVLFSLSAFANPSTFDTMVVFGDSLSDNGNLYRYMMHYIPASPPYSNGHFSNGNVWAEYLFSDLFQGKNKKAFLDYAVGGAGAVLASEEAMPYTLSVEINDYLYLHSNGKKSSSLYVIWIGANNYISGPSNVDSVTKKVTSAIGDGIETLIKNGANKFFIGNLPDLSRLPIANKNHSQILLNRLTMAHNQRLADKINALKIKYPNVTFVSFDAYHFFNEASLHAHDYGLTNITDPCYTGGYTQGSSLRAATVPDAFTLQQQFPDLPMSRIEQAKQNPVLAEALAMHALYLHEAPSLLTQASKCDTYLFWDHVHPTTNVHRYIALQARQTLDEAGLQPDIK